jgi:hypothetical protein
MNLTGAPTLYDLLPIVSLFISTTTTESGCNQVRAPAVSTHIQDRNHHQHLLLSFLLFISSVRSGGEEEERNAPHSVLSA